MLTKTLTFDLARRNIYVNTVAPGIIAAPMLDVIGFSDEARKTMLDRVPMRCLGHPREIGECVAFLCSDLAPYITGITLPVDGDGSPSGAMEPFHEIERFSSA